jgi:alkanesulfonate monooxygenase SsuD/methylene tetrahydromethanopterin reductase-like flavin-dependent oxidoreductase (luciferase family)
MKCHFFHLMPYPDLPEDFKSRYHSVWVDAPAAELFDPQVGQKAYNDYLDQLEFAGEVGFDGICVNEHHANAYGLMPSPNLMAATLARRTTKPKLVIMGNSVALYHPPIRVAEEMAMLDVMSGGRVIAGFPVGSPMDTAYCMGENPATLREKYYENVDFILRAWREKKVWAFNGKYSQHRYVNPWPRPMQQPHPPVWIPGGGSVETWEWCARNDYLYAYFSYFGAQAAHKGLAGYWEAVDRVGAEPNPYRAGFNTFVAVADNDAQAEKLYGAAALYFYDRCLHIYPGFAMPPGYVSAATLRKGVMGRIEAATGGDKLTWKSLVDGGAIAAGSPDTVVQLLTELCKTHKIGHLMMLAHFGNMSNQLARYNIERIAKEVLPRLRPIHSEWEDRWWPKTPALAEVS